MKRTLYAIVLTVVALPSFAAPPSCSNATTLGYYVATCQGQLSPAPGAPMLPTSLIATCATSSSNVFHCSGFANVGGTVLLQQLSGQANNNNDCTGTITYTQTLGGGPAPDLHITYIVADKGDTIYGLPFDPGQVLSCTLHRTGTL